MHDHIPENISNGIKIAVVDLLKPNEVKEKLPKSNDECKKRPKRKIKQFSRDKIILFLAEFVGTGILMFLGCMGCIAGFDEVAPAHQLSSLSFGLVVMLVIQVFGHISGAHLNPAVTIATVYLGYLDLSVSIIYFVAEFSGAFAGFGLLKLLTPVEFLNPGNGTVGLCTTIPYASTSTVQALALETIITTILILVCCAVWDRRNADKPDSVPLRFGFIIAVISMAAGPLTGASMNTARTLAPAVFNNNWQDHWIYWLGPNAGGIIGAGLYKFLFSAPEEPSKQVSETEQMERISVNP